MSDFESFGEVVKFIMIMSEFEVVSHFAHFWSQFWCDTFQIEV